MSTTTLLFYLLAAAAIVSASFVISCHKALHSALSLMVTLLSLAGLYLMLYAPFVASVQVLVYAGAIMASFLIAIAIVKNVTTSEKSHSNPDWIIRLASACPLIAFFFYAFAKSRQLFPDRMVVAQGSNTQQIATLLYGEPGRIGPYTLTLEIAALLLLVAILGAIIMTAIIMTKNVQITD